MTGFPGVLQTEKCRFSKLFCKTREKFHDMELAFRLNQT